MAEFKNCVPLYNALGEQVIRELPVLDLGNRGGSTDYIDFIRAEEMEFPVMRGVDKFRRPFIAIKVNCVDSALEKQMVGTIFQRYTDNDVNWAYGTCYEQNIIYWDSRLRLEDYRNLETRLKKLFSGGSVKSVDFWPKDNAPVDTRVGNGNWVVTVDVVAKQETHHTVPPLSSLGKAQLVV